jgi:hypothetical protein
MDLGFLSSFFFFFFFFRIVLAVGFCGFCVWLKVVICLFGEKVKENQQQVSQSSGNGVGKLFLADPSSGRGKGEGESRFFLFFFLFLWKTTIYPIKFTPICNPGTNV